MKQAEAPWILALAVARAESESPELFREVYETTLRALEGSADEDPERWREMVDFVLTCALARGPEPDFEEWVDAARRSQARIEHAEEVEGMAQSVLEKSFRAGRVEGREEGREEGAVTTLRDVVMIILEDRFGQLSEAGRRRIAAESNLDRLKAAQRAATRVERPEEALSFLGPSTP